MLYGTYVFRMFVFAVVHTEGMSVIMLYLRTQLFCVAVVPYRTIHSQGMSAIMLLVQVRYVGTYRTQDVYYNVGSRYRYRRYVPTMSVLMLCLSQCCATRYRSCLLFSILSFMSDRT